MEQVPNDFWKEACQVVNHPMACVGMDNKFVWVNVAFEQLVGYSKTELEQMTWMDITVQKDVGGDLASVNAVINGTASKYTMAKHYRHKHGRVIPIEELTVWRFPRASSEVMKCFIVEAIPERASTTEISELREELYEQMKVFRERIDMLMEDRSKTSISFTPQNNIAPTIGDQIDATGASGNVAAGASTITGMAPLPPQSWRWQKGWIAGAIFVLTLFGIGLRVAYQSGFIRFAVPPPVEAHER